MKRTLAAAVMCAALVAGSAAHASDSAPLVAIATSMGTIVVRLDPARAPVTVANFLHYVDTHAYDGTSFYRVVRRASEPQARIEVVQGGLNPQAPNPMVKPIPLEPTSKTGLHNTNGALAMARTSDPNSATTEFFIDVGDDRYLDAGGPLDPGYAVFGRVLRGMDVVLRIHRAPAAGEALTPPVRIIRMTRAAG